MFTKFLTHLVLREALVWEKESVEFYRVAAERVNSPPARELLLKLAEAESLHLASIQDLLKDHGSAEEAKPAPKEVPPLGLTPAPGVKALSQSSSVEEVLAVALRRERITYEFYVALAEKSILPAVKKAFAALAQHEREHMDTIDRIRERD